MHVFSGFEQLLVVVSVGYFNGPGSIKDAKDISEVDLLVQSKQFFFHFNEKPQKNAAHKLSLELFFVKKTKAFFLVSWNLIKSFLLSFTTFRSYEIFFFTFTPFRSYEISLFQRKVRPKWLTTQRIFPRSQHAVESPERMLTSATPFAMTEVWTTSGRRKVRVNKLCQTRNHLTRTWFLITKVITPIFMNTLFLQLSIIFHITLNYWTPSILELCNLERDRWKKRYWSKSDSFGNKMRSSLWVTSFTFLCPKLTFSFVRQQNWQYTEEKLIKNS